MKNSHVHLIEFGQSIFTGGGCGFYENDLSIAYRFCVALLIHKNDFDYVRIIENASHKITSYVFLILCAQEFFRKHPEQLSSLDFQHQFLRLE